MILPGRRFVGLLQALASLLQAADLGLLEALAQRLTSCVPSGLIATGRCAICGGLLVSSLLEVLGHLVERDGADLIGARVALAAALVPDLVGKGRPRRSDVFSSGVAALRWACSSSCSRR